MVGWGVEAQQTVLHWNLREELYRKTQLRTILRKEKG